MTREEALATCFANLRGTRQKDLLATARSLRFLKQLPEFGSNARVAAAVAISPEMVREFLLLLELPVEVQVLLDQQRLGLEQGRRLSQLMTARPADVNAAALAMTEMSAMDSRHLVEYLLRHRDISVQDGKQALLSRKTTEVRRYHVVAILSEPKFKKLKLAARQRGVKTPSELVTKIIESWLEAEG